jgi:hypothetical protein
MSPWASFPNTETIQQVVSEEELPRSPLYPRESAHLPDTSMRDPLWGAAWSVGGDGERSRGNAGGIGCIAPDRKSNVQQAGR